MNPIGIGWAAPTILHAGTQEQKDRYLMPLLAGEQVWCQLFSDPQAASDLATLGTRAVPPGYDYVVNGQQIRPPLARFSNSRRLSARTHPKQPKHPYRVNLLC